MCKAMEPGDPQVRPNIKSNLWEYGPGMTTRVIYIGDVEQGLKEADDVVEGHYQTGEQDHAAGHGSLGKETMIRGVHHTCITVSNLGRSIEFYRDLLGLELLFTEESERSQDDRSRALGIAGAKVKLAILRAGDARVELIEYVTAGGRPYDRRVNDVGAMHIAFQVEDIDGVFRRMVDHGVRFTAPPATIPAGPMAGWRWTYFFDPDGVSLEIIQTA